MNRRFTLLILIGFLAFVPTAVAATQVSGTIMIENGTADGASVTITPVSENFRTIAEPVTTTVSGTSFSANVPDAPVYIVRIVQGGATHYAVLRDTNSTTIVLNSSITGHIKTNSSTPQANATVELVDENGFSVDRTLTNTTGNFSFGPVKPNETYQLRISVAGTPYRQVVNTSDGDRIVTISTPPPTDNTSVLRVANRSPAGHVLQILAPRNESGVPRVVETILLQNTADRPFVGTVPVSIPANAKLYSGMVQGETAAYRRTGNSVRLNVTIPANGTTRVGVAYDLADQRFEKRILWNTTHLAVVFQGYNASAIGHSSNLRVGNASISLLTNAEPLQANDSISVNVSGANTDRLNMNLGMSKANATGPSESSSLITFPALPIFGGLTLIVGSGLLAYRVL